ncbi:MAG: TonB-dependent receptor [Phycisphaerae bacterium]|nr:TonB-dependent receptor [Phycisphaerae bacterium]
MATLKMTNDFAVGAISDMGRRRFSPDPVVASIALAVAAAVAAVPVVNAQSDVLEEVVVSAQKRDESLQQVPVAITAISGEALDAMGAQNFLDYALNAPSLSFGVSGIEGRATRSQISIRGVSGGGTTATYVNETLVPASLNLRLVDVERIEILRGPQGTLYGSGAMGGVVKVVTRRPDPSGFGGSLSSSVGRTDGGGDADYAFESALNLPIGAGLGAARVVAYTAREAGFIDRIFGQALPYAPEIPTATLAKGVAKDVNGSQTDGVRVEGAFKPADGWEIAPSIHWQRTRQNGATDVDVNAASRGTQFRSFDLAEPLRETAKLAQVTVTFKGEAIAFVSSTSYWDRKFFEGEDNTETFDAAVRGDYAVASVPPYPSIITNDWTQDSLQQELRLNGAFGSRTEWLVGGFYQKSKGLRKIRYSMPGWSADPRYFNPGLGDLLFSTDGAGSSRDLAAFTSVTFKGIDRTRIAAGLRFFDRNSRDSGNETGIFAGGAGPFVNRTSESGVTPRLSVDYSVSDRTMIFASAAKGYRNGGTQSPLPPQCAAEAALIGVNTGGYDADTTWNYEAGFKTRLGARGTLNASVYRIDWSDLQQTVRLASCGFSRTGNVGEVRVNGIEVESQFAITDGLSVAASVGLMDPKVVDPGVGTRSERGDRPLNVAKINASVSADYAFNWTAAIKGVARLDYQHLGDSFTTFNQTEPVRVTQTQAYRRRDAINLLNARLGVRPNERTEISLYGRNLSNTSANYGEVAPIGIDRANRPRYATNRPRLFGLEVTYQF